MGFWKQIFLLFKNEAWKFIQQQKKIFLDNLFIASVLGILGVVFIFSGNGTKFLNAVADSILFYSLLFVAQFIHVSFLLFDCWRQKYPTNNICKIHEFLHKQHEQAIFTIGSFLSTLIGVGLVMAVFEIFLEFKSNLLCLVLITALILYFLMFFSTRQEFFNQTYYLSIDEGIRRNSGMKAGRMLAYFLLRPRLFVFLINLALLALLFCYVWNEVHKL
ncbi:hypothetical protein [Neisseria chenwenguii]|nr:hypothetical protein [Neisseria chenwenguii]